MSGTQMTKAEWFEQVAKVAPLQNHPANLDQDHMTICGFFTTREQFERHITDLERRIARFEVEAKAA